MSSRCQPRNRKLDRFEQGATELATNREALELAGGLVAIALAGHRVEHQGISEAAGDGIETQTQAVAVQIGRSKLAGAGIAADAEQQSRRPGV